MTLTTPRYRVVIHSQPARECWAEYDRGWDALQCAKDAARQGYDADVLYDGKLERSFEAHVQRAEA